MKKRTKNHLKLGMFAALALGVWLGMSRCMEGYAASIGPEFLVRAPIKVFYVILAAWLTLHCDKWVAPVIAKWCDRDFADLHSEFEKAWRENPSDPRIRLCVAFYCSVFVGLCVVFSL